MELDSLKMRRPGRSFGWVDRRIITGGHLTQMQQVEVATYLLLCVVADRHGISYYHPANLARLIKHPADGVRLALKSLAVLEFIAVKDQFIQVVDLDDLAQALASVPVSTAGRSELKPASLSADVPAEPAVVVLGRLPVDEREELLRRARDHFARFLGHREPSPSALEAVAVGLLRQGSGSR